MPTTVVRLDKHSDEFMLAHVETVFARVQEKKITALLRTFKVFD